MNQESWRFGRNWQSWIPMYDFGVCRDPRDFDLVWIMRPDWAEPQPVNPKTLPLWFNVAGLLWTPDPPPVHGHEARP